MGTSADEGITLFATARGGSVRTHAVVGNSVKLGSGEMTNSVGRVGEGGERTRRRRIGNVGETCESRGARSSYTAPRSPTASRHAPARAGVR
jgi:hypothetical protein